MNNDRDRRSYSLLQEHHAVVIMMLVRRPIFVIPDPMGSLMRVMNSTVFALAPSLSIK